MNCPGCGNQLYRDSCSRCGWKNVNAVEALISYLDENSGPWVVGLACFPLDPNQQGTTYGQIQTLVTNAQLDKDRKVFAFFDDRDNRVSFIEIVANSLDKPYINDHGTYVANYNNAVAPVSNDLNNCPVWLFYIFPHRPVKE